MSFPKFTRSGWVKAGCLVFLAGNILMQPWFGVLSFGPEEIAFYRDIGQKMRVTGEVSGEPDVRSDGQNFVVEAKGILLPGGNDRAGGAESAGGAISRRVSGKIMVKAKRYPEFSYGDRLDIICELQTPPIFEKFSYAALLAKDNIFVLCSRPVIQAKDAGSAANESRGDFFHAGSGFWKTVFWLKNATVEQINRLFAEPTASLVAGILIGQRRAIPQEILDDFNTTGLTHVLAISGYNVSMMISVFGYLLKGAARRHRIAGMFGGVLALVAFTGFSSSVLRAAWMGCIALIAQTLGRKGSGLHLLLISGVIMAFVSPRMILVDMSFQLSFLSTLGILVFMPKIEAFEQKLIQRPRFAWISKIPSFMREGFCVTLAAQVFTTPLLIFQFGRFSLIAPFANIFVLPLVPWIMLFGFCSVMVSFVIFPAGQLLSFVAHVLVAIMLFITNFFANLPFASLDL